MKLTKVQMSALSRTIFFERNNNRSVSPISDEPERAALVALATKGVIEARDRLSLAHGPHDYRVTKFGMAIWRSA